MTSAKVAFVGAGAGDPRLLTVRGAELLATADVVFFDPEVHPEVLARARDDAERLQVAASARAEDTGRQLATAAKQGKNVVRLAWADPLMFGRADVEASSVARTGIAIEVVPGIGPLVAVGAFAGVPLTRLSDASQSVAFASVTRGHESLHDWQKLATATDTLALVCDTESLGEVARSLVFFGRSSAEALTVVESISLPSQRSTTTTLGDLPFAKWTSRRVVVVIGERATPRTELTWFEKQPLFGKRILVTRTREQASSASSVLRELGADVVVMPTIEIHPPSDPSPLIDAVASLRERYRWVVATSANGVERLWAEVTRQGHDARAFGNTKLAAIGPATAAAFARCGLVVDIVAKEHKGEGLAEAMVAALGAESGRVLVARAEVARDVVPDTLKAAGFEVDVVATYRTRSPPRALFAGLAALLESGDIDAVTFTSSSTVEHVCDALEARAKELLSRTCVASIGPETTKTAEKKGIVVDLTAPQHTMASLISSLVEHFEGRSSKGI